MPLSFSTERMCLNFRTPFERNHKQKEKLSKGSEFPQHHNGETATRDQARLPYRLVHAIMGKNRNRVFPHAFREKPFGITLFVRFFAPETKQQSKQQKKELIMKRFILSLAMLLTVCISTMAMSYEQARDRALFLTDKMAYELNLNDEQYEAAYEVNLDYLMSINTYDDLYGTYWTRRNLDLGYILFDWQYNAYCAAAYFYRPLTWADGIWRFGIYARYPNRAYFYFGRPGFYASYHGAHSWRMNGGQSWYHGRTFGPRPGESRFGMRDRFDRGDFGGHRTDNHSYGRNDRGNYRNNNRNGNFGNNNGRNDRGNIDRGNGNRNDRNDNGSGYSRGDRNGNGTTISTTRQNRSWEKMSTQPQSVQQQRMQNNTSNGRLMRQSSTRTTVTRETPRMSTPSREIRNTNTVSRPATMTTSRPATTFSPSSNRGGGNMGSGASQSAGRSGGGGHFGGRR